MDPASNDGSTPENPAGWGQGRRLRSGLEGDFSFALQVEVSGRSEVKGEEAMRKLQLLQRGGEFAFLF